jgi:hypothetical protein
MFIKNITKHHSHYIWRKSAVWFDVNILEGFIEIMRIQKFFQNSSKNSIIPKKPV